MDELKLITINEEGVFCHYYPALSKEFFIIPVSYTVIPVFIFALDEDGIEDFIGIMESGIIWCKNFRYSKYGTDGIRLKVFI
ncbi:MAG: hypothetical protein ACTSSF_00330 [Candidatus Heimdallarchaeaceae archaeon]